MEDKVFLNIVVFVLFLIAVAWVICFLMVERFGKHLQDISGSDYDELKGRFGSKGSRFLWAPLNWIALLGIRHNLECQAYFGIWLVEMKGNAYSEYYTVRKQEKFLIDRALTEAARCMEAAFKLEEAQRPGNSSAIHRMVKFAKNNFWTMHRIAASHGFEVEVNYGDYLVDKTTSNAVSR